MDKFCSIPIDASIKGSKLPREYFSDKPFPAEFACVPTARLSMNSNAFAFLTEIARIITEGTKWNKKARIILEYDPNEPKMQITSYMENENLEGKA